MTFETGIIFFISLLLLWAKPGPGQALRLTCALDKGFVKAFAISLGVITICLFYFLIVAFGYKALIDLFEFLGQILKIAGGLYLCYLGIRGLRVKPKVSDGAKPVVEDNAGLTRYYGLGLMMALSNPITIFYFISILPTLIPVGTMTVNDVVYGLILIAMAGVIVDLLLLVLVVQARQLMSESAFMKYVGLIASVVFILIGLFLIYSAIFLDDFSFQMT